MAATGADTSYRPAIYRARGGKQLVIKATATQTVFGGLAVGSGGSFAIQSGGTASIDSGATGTVSGGLAVAAGGTVTYGTGSKTVRALVNATASVALAAARSGTRYLSAVVGNIFTLPAATTAGNGINFRINTASGGHFASATAGSSGVNFKLRPQAADTIYGAGVAGATDSEVVQQLATGSVVGDGLEVECDGTNWVITSRSGTYNRAAAT